MSRKNGNKFKSEVTFGTFLLDACDLLECSGLGSNQCVNGRCVCGSAGGICSSTTPVCYGSGLSATCVCYPGSCNEPNPVCDPTDGTCKVSDTTSYTKQFFSGVIFVILRPTLMEKS
jgi:hypothetical protein